MGSMEIEYETARGLSLATVTFDLG